jgi:ketosteroid isomerase-like protein
MSYGWCFLLAVLSAPVAARDLKQEVEKVSSAYAESFNKQDAAGIAALYAAGGVQVNAAGPRTDIAQAYEGLFKAGFNHNEIKVDQVSPLAANAALGIGEYHITGKNQGGEPVEVIGRWTAVYVSDHGKLKIRMLSAFPKAPPPK